MRRWWVILFCVFIGAGLYLAAAYDGWPPDRSRFLPIIQTRGAEPWPPWIDVEAFPPRAERVTVFRGFGTTREVWDAVSNTTFFSAERVSWGWPIPSLTRTEWHAANAAVLPADDRWFRIGPMRVLWGGTLLSTGMYSAVVWLVLWTMGAIRRARRLRRDALVGCCTHCGYNLSGLVPGLPCPECGREGRGVIAA